MKRFLILFLLIVLSFVVTVANAQDLKSQLDVTTAIAPHNNKTDVESSAIDSINYKSTLLYVYTGPATYTADNKLEIHSAIHRTAPIHLCWKEMYGAMKLLLQAEPY